MNDWTFGYCIGEYATASVAIEQSTRLGNKLHCPSGMYTGTLRWAWTAWPYATHS